MMKAVFEIGRQYFSEKTALYHYYGTANSTFKQYLQKEEVKYKKYVYALRPLLACKYIEDHHSVPPVKFDDLLRQNLPAELSVEIEKMLEIKTKSDETDLNPKMPTIQKFIEDEIAKYEQIIKNMPDDRNPDWETLDSVFLRILI